MVKGKNQTKPLTEEEIWDDSALVRTWDEAVEEYQLYHSIHAKGENIEDVLRAADEEGPQDEQVEDEGRMETGGDSPVVVPTAVPVEAAQETTEPHTQHPKQSSIPPTEPTTAAEPSSGTAAPPMPHPVMVSVQDEGLKNLMMSWYYAGYYTGLYEGQQKAQSGAR